MTMPTTKTARMPTTKTMTMTATLLILLLTISPPFCYASSYQGEEGSPDFDFEKEAFVAHSLKINVHATTEECVYQKVRAGSQANLGFEVLSGGERDISLYIMDNKMEVLSKFEGKQDGSWEHNFEQDDVVSLCFENYESRFHDKLVFFYFSAFIHHELNEKQKEEDKKMEEEHKNKEDFHLANINTNHVIDRVGDQLMNMTYSQSIAKMHMVADYYVTEANNAWVMRWSIIQIVVIVCTACSQVFFVRRMFGSVDETTTPTGNVRA